MKLRDGLRLRRCASLVIARWIRGHACVSLFISVCVWMFIMAGNDNRRRSEPFRKTTTMKMGRRLVWPHLLYHTRRKTNLFGCFFSSACVCSFHFHSPNLLLFHSTRRTTACASVNGWHAGSSLSYLSLCASCCEMPLIIMTCSRQFI